MRRLMRSLLLPLIVHALKSTDIKSVAPVQRAAAGQVVLAPRNEYNHFLRQAAVLVVEHTERGSLGVSLDSPTLLTIGEAAKGLLEDSELAENRLFMGGEYGGDSATMIHACEDVAGARRLGGSDLFLGGLADAAKRVNAGINRPEDFKFFFNFCKWAPGELDDAIADGRWRALTGVPREVVLDQDPFADRAGGEAETFKSDARAVAARSRIIGGRSGGRRDAPSSQTAHKVVTQTRQRAA